MGKQKKLSGQFEPDYARYRKAGEPHESPKAAEDAISAFYEELAELRVKYQVKDLYVIYNLAVIEEGGKEGCATGMTGFGTQSLFESMAACAYGAEKRSREANIRRMLSEQE